MKNWKKWAAGICALSLCMTAVSLPAAAEGEDDIALISDTSEEMPAADGTADADTADDTAEEATRSESLEEIAITAEQVTQYMQKKNSCDGITFYYRPEDYEDTISDEDVADLLDDIELAGIDDATGEVVCTLEEDSDKACADYNEIIRSVGGIDIQLLGIGGNGHIGFNEPGEAFEKETHCVDLTESTIKANARFFESMDEVPKQAYTMGIKNIMAAKKILLVATGSAKADALYKSLYGPITPNVPASILQLHQDVTVVADEDALSLIKEKGLL